MLIIKPIQDAALQTALCERCGVPYRPGCLCYQAHLGEGPDDETVFVGISQFSVGEVDGERIIGRMMDLVTAPDIDDEEALFIMGRQTLNFMDLTGTHEAYFEAKDGDNEHLIKWLGFRMTDGAWYYDLHGKFDAHDHKH